MNERAQFAAAPARSQQAAPDAFAQAAAWIRAQRPLRNRRLQEISAELRKDVMGNAEKALRGFLARYPNDPDAVMLMAQAALRRGRTGEAEKLLVQCLQLDPSFIAARFDRATLLLEENEGETALIECEKLLKYEPQNPLFRRLKARALEVNGEYIASLELWRALTLDCPAQPECWSGYGNALSIVGLPEDSIAAFRKAVALNPAFSVGWLCLADLKTVRFSTSEIEEMETQLGAAGASSEDRTNLHFSLGKAYADLNLYEKSFNNFARGNAIRRLAVKHDADVLTAYVSRCKQAFTADLFRTHAGSGCGSSGPIFLVGIPRAGSTLVEQILASHSQIEGTAELFNLSVLARELQQLAAGQGSTYPAILAELDSGKLRRFGERYLENTQDRRKLGRRFFIDKMGSNFFYIGLIHLILPNARIVDVRRHPMACCFSNFSQVFPKGLNNAYRLTDLARVYRDYVSLMAHFDLVLPGKVHRLFYENLIEDPEKEIRRLLDHLGLPFEDACLNFFNTARAITTVSSEQVRRPIYREALEHWRHYEPWLGALKTALGSVLDLYPEVPSFD